MIKLCYELRLLTPSMKNMNDEQVLTTTTVEERAQFGLHSTEAGVSLVVWDTDEPNRIVQYDEKTMKWKASLLESEESQGT
jgi:hypothetical protein